MNLLESRAITESAPKQNDGPFIVIGRPHQRPGSAGIYESKEDLITAWINGVVREARFYDADSIIDMFPNWDSLSVDERFEEAIADLAHDLSGLDVIRSASEYSVWLMYPRHNKPYAEAAACAAGLSWVEDEDDDDDDDDDDPTE